MQYNKQIEELDLLASLPIEKVASFHQFLIETAELDNFRITPIANDCSGRTYYRVLTSEGSKILMDSQTEMKSYHDFIKVCDWLRSEGLRSPQIFAKDSEHGLMLIEDFGDASLLSYLMQNPEQEIDLYQKSIDLLVKLHNTIPSTELKEHDHEVLSSGLQRLFMNNYLPIIIPENRLHKARAELTAIFDDLYRMLPLMKQVVVLRDYHAENLMVLSDSNLGIIDFQDAMIGCPAYDLLSLLEDARREIKPELAIHCINYYHTQAATQNYNEFDEAYAILSAQRNLRIIGLFHKLYILENKEKYGPCIPRVTGYLANTLKHPRLAALNAWIEKYNVLSNDELNRK